MKNVSLFLFLSLGFGAFAQEPITAADQHKFGVGLKELTGIHFLEFVGGYGEQTENFRLAAHWPWRLKTVGNWDVHISLAANYSYFGGDRQIRGKTVQIRDIGLTPTGAIYFKRSFLGMKPYAEAGIGLHYLTDTAFTHKNFSTHFQFGDHIGLGVQFGAKQNLRLTYQFQHLSNGGIDNPNPGINFHLLNLGVKLNR